VAKFWDKVDILISPAVSVDEEWLLTVSDSDSISGFVVVEVGDWGA